MTYFALGGTKTLTQSYDSVRVLKETQSRDKHELALSFLHSSQNSQVPTKGAVRFLFRLSNGGTVYRRKEDKTEVYMHVMMSEQGQGWTRAISTVEG